ncbi:MAG TPA: hypothetical protein VER35_03085 [Candidatus Limnocylindrales bacterium]|nr:hypothetical protein [Candidatus Limnocylindrales bacterium]
MEIKIEKKQHLNFCGLFALRMADGAAMSRRRRYINQVTAYPYALKK